MESYIKQTIILCLLVYTSCEQPGFIGQETSDDALEQLIARDWQYEALLINGDTLNVLNLDFEPWQGSNDIQHVKFRWFKYHRNKTYEFREDTDFINFSLGENENYQPRYGAWSLNASGDSLIHNEHDSFAKHYAIIELNNSLFIREYTRIIQQVRPEDSLRWPIGSKAVYREVLTVKK